MIVTGLVVKAGGWLAPIGPRPLAPQLLFSCPANRSIRFRRHNLHDLARILKLLGGPMGRPPLPSASESLTAIGRSASLSLNPAIISRSFTPNLFYNGLRALQDFIEQRSARQRYRSHATYFNAKRFFLGLGGAGDGIVPSRRPRRRERCVRCASRPTPGPSEPRARVQIGDHYR